MTHGLGLLKYWLVALRVLLAYLGLAAIVEHILGLFEIALFPGKGV